MSKTARCIVIAALFFVLAFLTGVVLAGPGEQAPPAAYAIVQASASGGSYRLAGGTWQARGTAGGPGYLLQGERGILQGAGCCCLYLPCLMDKR